MPESCHPSRLLGITVLLLVPVQTVTEAWPAREALWERRHVTRFSPPQFKIGFRNSAHQRVSPPASSMKVTQALLKGRSVWKGPNIVPLPIVRAVGDQKALPIKSVPIHPISTKCWEDQELTHQQDTSALCNHSAELCGLDVPGAHGQDVYQFHGDGGNGAITMGWWFGLRMLMSEQVGHKLGEFAPTRKPFRYKTTKNR